MNQTRKNTAKKLRENCSEFICKPTETIEDAACLCGNNLFRFGKRPGRAAQDFLCCRTLLTLFFAFWICGAMAAPKEKQFERIDMTSGLTNNTALCLLEDYDGYIWIGTRDGLNRYNGQNVETFKHIYGDSTSLINNQVNCLWQSNDREIWVGTANGLSKYEVQTRQFKSYIFQVDSVEFSTNHVRSIFEVEEGKFWIGTTHGLFQFDAKSESYKLLPVEEELSAEANRIRKIFRDSRRQIWIGTNAGLFRYANHRFENAKLPVAKNDDQAVVVREIVEDADGLLWMGTENHGIFMVDVADGRATVKRSLTTQNSALTSNTIRSIFFENDTNVWIGTFEGINIYNRNTGGFLLHSTDTKKTGSISHTSVRAIIADAAGGIWVATYLGGVNYYNPKKNLFKHDVWFTNRNTFLNSNIASVLVEDDDDLWIGTEGGGVYLSNDRGATITRRINTQNSELPHNSVKALQIGDGKLWIGTLSGLSACNLKTLQVENFVFEPNQPNSLLPGHVTTLFFENDERLWVGTLGGGVQCYNHKTKKFTNIPELAGKMLTCSYFDSDKNLWLGTETGVFVYDTQNKCLLDSPRDMPNWQNDFGYVTSIVEDTQNNVWICTRGKGLFLLHNKQLHWFNTSNGLPDNSVNSLLESMPNTYWIASNKGLSKIDLVYHDNAELQIVTHSYSSTQGLQGLQFSPQCALKSNSGMLMFGGINGLNKFYPGDIKETGFQPRLVFENLLLNYKVVQPGRPESPLLKRLNDTEEIRLKYTQRNFSLSFMGINFINPDNNIYRYKVEDINDSWIEIGASKSINFTYFPVGTHQIKVQATTDPGHWGNDYRTLNLTVLPPWWKTWWAFGIYFTVLILLLALFFLLSQRWAELKNQLAMQQFQSEKETELHQLKLKFYTDVSHELRTPLTLILAPLENLISKTEIPSRFRNQLIQIQRSGFRLMQLVNQILDLRKLETGHENLQVAQGNIIRFFTEISLAFKEVAQSKEINFEFMPHKEECVLWYDRDKLEIMINNLLSNAFKFTARRGQVKLTLSECKGQDLPESLDGMNKRNNYLQINVVDNGEGINPEDLKNIYKRFYSKRSDTNTLAPNAGVGLELTKRMVELHKGGISVSSHEVEPGKKETVFSIFLSLDKEVYKPEELDLEFKNSEDRSLYTTEFLQRETAIAVQEQVPESENAGGDDEFERLLIVEDNPEVRHFIKELFADNYEISEAENGETGLQKAIETNPQLIISDVMMPVMDGIELCRKIKTDARTSHIPVILLTARTALTFKYEGLETGADDYITKPFSAKYLALRVRNLIRQRKKIQEYFKREAICDPGSITLTSVDDTILKKAMDYIIKNMADPSLSINKISEEVGLSRVHFYRKIKALTNQTAVEFVRSVRLKRAASLLVQNKLSVKEVRNRVGFEDADYFRECFKEQFGVTPSEYTGDNS